MLIPESGSGCILEYYYIELENVLVTSPSITCQFPLQRNTRLPYSYFIKEKHVLTF